MVINRDLSSLRPSYGAISLIDRLDYQNRKNIAEMAKRVKPKVESQHKRQKSRSIPLEQVSPAVLTATRDVAYMLEQLSILPGPEDVLKAVLDRAEHLEEQASGITLFED